MTTTTVEKAAADPKPTPAKSKQKPTEYMVLVLHEPPAGTPTDSRTTGTPTDSRTSWVERKRVTATSSRDAVRQAAGGQAGTYLAVPARSYQPVTVRVETQTVIRSTDVHDPHAHARRQAVLEQARLAVEYDPERARLETLARHETARVYRAIMLAPTLDLCEDLLAGVPVPLERLDPHQVRRFGLRPHDAAA